MLDCTTTMQQYATELMQETAKYVSHQLQSTEYMNMDLIHAWGWWK